MRSITPPARPKSRPRNASTPPLFGLPLRLSGLRRHAAGGTSWVPVSLPSRAPRRRRRFGLRLRPDVLLVLLMVAASLLGTAWAATSPGSARVGALIGGAAAAGLLITLSLFGWVAVQSRSLGQLHATGRHNESGRRIDAEGRCFGAWFAAHHLAWLTASLLLSALMLVPRGATADLTLAAVGGLLTVAACALVGALLVLQPLLAGQAASVAVCWLSPIPRGVRNLLARAEATLLLSSRLTQVRNWDAGQPHSWLRKVVQVREAARAGRETFILDVRRPGGPTWRSEVAYRAAVFGAIWLFGALVALVALRAGLIAPLVPALTSITGTGPLETSPQDQPTMTPSPEDAAGGGGGGGQGQGEGEGAGQSGQGQGNGSGQGQGAGSGEGQAGQGSGQGAGAGQGDTSGQGSGEGAGAGDRQGQGSGQGDGTGQGQGQANGQGAASTQGQASTSGQGQASGDGQRSDQGASTGDGVGTDAGDGNRQGQGQGAGKAGDQPRGESAGPGQGQSQPEETGDASALRQGQNQGSGTGEGGSAGGGEGDGADGAGNPGPSRARNPDTAPTPPVLGAPTSVQIPSAASTDDIVSIDLPAVGPGQPAQGTPQPLPGQSLPAEPGRAGPQSQQERGATAEGSRKPGQPLQPWIQSLLDGEGAP
ncbi:MAG: hypothetical protein AB7K36_01940 [Chloroflexota bacterium]